MRTKTINTLSTPVLAILTLIIFATTNIKAAPGDLDPTFGDGGKAVDVSDYEIHDVAIQADGKIVTVGIAKVSFLVARYNSDGSPDGTFGHNGRIITSFGPDEAGAESVAIQTDGKIVVAGWKCECFDWGAEAFVLIRYNPDGSLDASFDGDGIVTTKIGLWPTGTSVVIQPDQKIVVGGFTWERFGDYADDHFALARYNPDGSLDPTFDGDGKVITKPSACGFCNDDLQSIALQPDGKIVAIGGIFAYKLPTRFVIVRYNVDGSVDPTLHFDGNSIDPRGDGGYFTAVTTQADGKILAAGTYWSGTLLLVRLNPDGTFDTTFDFDGSVTTPGTSDSYVAIQSNGKILLAGTGYSGSSRDFQLIRYSPDGSLDTTFGGGDGETIVDFGGSGDDVAGIALDRAGRAVVAGRLWEGNIARGIGMARFLLGSMQANADFDGDGKTDLSVFRPSVGEWYYQQSSNGVTRGFGFGTSTDKVATADFTGDGKTDIAFWRASTGDWYVLRSEDSTYFAFPFGASGDIPTPADYDGDGKSDAAVFRPAIVTWFILRSSGGVSSVPFGISSDVPVPADYDGDGKADVGIFRPGPGQWWNLRSSNGSVFAATFGSPTDKPVPGDYTGDGKADVAFYRPSEGSWYVLRSEDFSFFAFPFGNSTDKPAPADYDGDGKFDAAVFRPSDTNWYVLKSTGGVFIQQFGAANDIPLPGAFVP